MVAGFRWWLATTVVALESPRPFDEGSAVVALGPVGTTETGLSQIMATNPLKNHCVLLWSRLRGKP
jgi:hypothetical protein